MRILSLADEIDAQRRQQALGRWSMHVDPFQMPDQEFVNTYRLSKDLARQLIDRLATCIPKERRKDGFPVQAKVLIALAFYASGSYQTSVAQSHGSHGVSQSTVSRAIREVTRALNTRSIFTDYVKFPMSREARDDIKNSFHRKFKLPGVIGCIDGTHVPIIRPRQIEEQYLNRKRYHSLNVMIICDADLNILCVDPSKPGASHDSEVWYDHPLQPYLDQIYDEEQVYLLGDSGYLSHRTMMTPVLNTIPGSPEAHYNKVHVSAHNTVDRCIGDLKARFRCLLGRALHYNPVFAGEIVNACAVLHNIANEARLPVPQLTLPEYKHEMRMRVRCRATDELLKGQAVQQALINLLWLNRQKEDTGTIHYHHQPNHMDRLNT